MCHSFPTEGVLQVCFCDDLKSVLCVSSSSERAAALLCAAQHFSLHWQPKGPHTSKVTLSIYGMDRAAFLHLETQV